MNSTLLGAAVFGVIVGHFKDCRVPMDGGPMDGGTDSSSPLADAAGESGPVEDAPTEAAVSEDSMSDGVGEATTDASPCPPPDVTATPVLCNGTCVDINSDINNCGGCGVRCPRGSGAFSCTRGQCTCLGLSCPSGCFNPQTMCTCGGCPSGTTCRSGRCQ